VDAQSEGWELHRLRVPGDVLHPTNLHWFQVVARYLFADGTPLPQPKGPATGLTALVSEEPYRPTPRNPNAPAIEAFPAELGLVSGRCAAVRLPQDAAEGLGVHDAGGQALVLEVREGRPGVSSIEASGAWAAVAERNVEVQKLDRNLVLVRDLAPQVCQFRLRRGPSESQPSGFTDASVWRPLPLVGEELCAQMRGVASGGRWAGQSLTGLGIALGVASDSSIFARLIWPRQPPQPCAVALGKYQVRYRMCGDEWHSLPMVELPPGDAAFAECQVSELRYGQLYEFTLRLGNVLSRWSEWSPATAPVRMELPPPVPGRNVEKGGLRVAVVSPSVVKLVWRPFIVPIRSDRVEAPILLDASSGQRGGVTAEYEVIVRAADGSIVSVVQHEAPAIFEDLQADSSAWIEADLPVEPRRPSCSFEIRARLRRGPWGPSVLSPALPSWLPSASAEPAKASAAGSPARCSHAYPSEPVAT